MKHSSNAKRHIVRRILSGALSVAVVLSGLVTTAIPTRAVGAATTHYEFVATADADANFAELQPNLTVGAKAGSYSNVRANVNATFYTEDGSFSTIRLFRLYNWVGTRSETGALTNNIAVNDPDYHYGLAKYRTYCSDDLYTDNTRSTVYYKAPTVNLEMVPQSFKPLDTTDIGAANLSLIIATPVQAGNTMNVAFDRRLQVKVSLDGTTWLSGKAELRSGEFLGGGKIGSSDYQLFRFETDDLLSIPGVKGNTIQAIKVLPDGSSDCSRSNFYIHQMQVNTYATADDFNAICPEEVIATTTYSSGDELRKIVLAEALRTVKTRWFSEETITTVSPSGSSAVDSNYNAKTYPRTETETYIKYTNDYLAPVYDRETDASREQFWSQFDGYDTENHSMTVTLPQTGSTTITVAAPKNAQYTAEDLCFRDTYQNKDAEGNVTQTLSSKHPYGMDCQTFVFNAISRVSRTSAVGAATTFGATRTRIVQPASSTGLGNLTVRSHPLYTDWDIAKQNSEQKMYESYAAAQPGDIAVHNLSNHVCNVHTRLVRSVSVVRNSDGTINPTESKMYFMEEAGGEPAVIETKQTASLGTTGARTKSTARDNNEVTFASLLNVGSSGGSYVIYTLNEYQDGVVENAKVQAVAGSKQTNTNFWDGGLHLSFNSNYRIIRYQVKLVNAAGNTLFDSGLQYPIAPCATGINYTNRELDTSLLNLPNGSYKIVWEVHSGPFTDYEQVDVPVQTDEIEFTVTDRNNGPECGSHSGWSAIGTAATLESKTYYLSQNISGMITVPGGVNATLCLNGYSLTSGEAASAIEVAGKLTLCNCSETAASYVTGTSSKPMINISGGTLELYNGVVVTNKGVATKGGGVYLSDGVFDMNGGTIIGCTAEQGGGVYMNNGTFNMMGGIITGNTAKGTETSTNEETTYKDPFGAGVYVNGGMFTMEAGAIGENIGGNGKGVYVAKNGAFKMTGGAVRAESSSVYSLAERTPTLLSGGTISSSGSSLVIGTSEREVKLSGNVVVTGNVDNYGIFTMEGGTVNGTVNANVLSNMTPASTVIKGGAINGILSAVTRESGTEEEGNKVTATGKIAVVGGKFSAAMSRDELLSFVPEESDTMTTIYSVKDCEDGDMAYEVVEGLCSGTEEKFMDFRSSLDFGVILHADRNFNPYDFADAANGYTASAISEYGTAYNVSFDTTTIPGALILWARGIAAKEMQDNIVFTVRDCANKVLFNESWSVYQVAELWHGDENTSDQTLLADMINYGNEARKAFSYHYAEGVELPTLSGATSEEPVWGAVAGAGATNGQQKNVAATLSLRERIELNIYINNAAAEISDVKFNGVYYDEANYKVDTTSGKYTRITFDNIPVVKAKGKLEFTVTMNDGTAFDMKYSIAEYARLAAQDQNNSQRDLIVALQKYVDSVYRYFGVAVDWVEPDYSDDEIGAIVLPTIKSN